MASLSQGLVLTTTMLVSSTVLYLAYSWHKITPPFQIHGNHDSHNSRKQILHSCLYSEEKRRERKMMMKRVKFADNMKEARETSELTKKEKHRRRNRVASTSRHEISEIRKMPANRIVLFKGILRDQVVHRIKCSY